MKTDVENLEERMGMLDGLLATARAVVESLECAESVETPEDFDANLREAAQGASLVSCECDLLLEGKL